MKASADQVLDKLIEVLSTVAPAKTGFYQYGRLSTHLPCITVQTTEIKTSKNGQKDELQVLVIISADALAANADRLLITLCQNVQKALLAEQKINSNLDGLAREIVELSDAKIIAPDPNQPTAQGLLNYKITY